MNQQQQSEQQQHEQWRLIDDVGTLQHAIWRGQLGTVERNHVVTRASLRQGLQSLHSYLVGARSGNSSIYHWSLLQTPICCAALNLSQNHISVNVYLPKKSEASSSIRMADSLNLRGLKVECVAFNRKEGGETQTKQIDVQDHLELMRQHGEDDEADAAASQIVVHFRRLKPNCKYRIIVHPTDGVGKLLSLPPSLPLDIVTVPPLQVSLDDVGDRYCFVRVGRRDVTGKRFSCARLKIDAAVSTTENDDEFHNYGKSY